MNHKFLYRALREEEVKKGCVLIPKCFSSFKSEPTFPLQFTVKFGNITENAIDNHQRFNGKFKTRGVSTTPHLEIAKNKYAQEHKTIAKINTCNFEQLEITSFVVKEHLPPSRIVFPEDDEIILVYKHDTPFPEGIIEEIIKL